MEQKLIFFDIDGTLITEGKDSYVPQSTTLALELLKENGHKCIINTGRPFAGLDDLIKSINVDGYVCGCGTNIRIGENILTSNHFEKELSLKIINALDENKIEWMLEGEYGLYYSTNPYKSSIERTVLSMKKKLANNIFQISKNDYSNVVFDKFIMVAQDNDGFERFYNEFKDTLTFINRNNKFYEVIPIQFSKATGMKYLEKYFNIPHENTFAVGDSSNDIAMLEYAATGILMGGAEKELLKYCDYETTSIEEDGIFNAFKHFELI